MRIHSSSLTLTHAGFNRQQAGITSSARSNDEKIVIPVAADSSPSHSLPSTFRPSDEIEPILDIAGINSHFTDKENAVPPRDSRILKALSAYRQELNKALPDQHARVAKVIDTYA